MDIGSRIIYLDPSSPEVDTPNIFIGTVTKVYLDPTDNCRVLYSLSIDGTEPNVDGVDRDMIQPLKNPGGSNASKTPTKRKPEATWNGEDLRLKKTVVTTPGPTIGAATTRAPAYPNWTGGTNSFQGQPSPNREWQVTGGAQGVEGHPSTWGIPGAPVPTNQATVPGTTTGGPAFGTTTTPIPNATPW